MIQDMDDYESVDDADEGNDDGPVVGVAGWDSTDSNYRRGLGRS